MDIAIIGAGNVGRAPATSTVRAGHNVTLSSADLEHAAAVAEEVGAHSAKSNREAVEGAEAVILAVPYPVVEEILREVGDALAGKILIDVTNRMDPADPTATLDGTSASEQIQSKARQARVVKAFNTVFAANQANPSAGMGNRIARPCCPCPSTRSLPAREARFSQSSKPWGSRL